MPQPGERLLGFDWIRAVAVLLVLGRHREIHPLWFQAGWIGVDCFFVLSGFLVSQLLFTEYRFSKRISPARFLIRRGFKIYPGFLALLAVSSVYFVVRKGGLPAEKFLAEALFLQNYLEGLNQHTWSLAVEEHFYLVLAIGCALVARKTSWLDGRSRIVPKLLAALIVLVAATRVASAALLPYSVPLHFAGTHARVDGLLFGVLISYFYCFERARFCEFVRRRRVPIVLCSCLLLVPVLFWKVDDLIVYSIGYSMLYLGFGGILACIAAGTGCVTPSVHGRLARLGASLGAYSYSVYLWHMPIAGWGMNLLQRLSPIDLRGAWGDAVYLSAAIATGVLMGRLIEYPALKLRDRWFPSARQALPIPTLAPSGEEYRTV